MQKKQWISYLGKLIFLIPLFLGTYGLFSHGMPFLDALFSAVQMYALNYGGEVNPPLVEIARWTAPLATTGGVILAVHTLRKRLRFLLVYSRGDSVAVYGNGTEKATVLKKLGCKGMDPEERFIKAHNYILMGEESENLAFYDAHRKDLAHRMVYLKCSSLNPQSAVEANLRLYSHEELAARLFWKEHNLYQKSRQLDHKMDIVCIGFGRLGEELLLYGLQYNIFHPNQAITYHIFDGDAAFAAVRPGLANISDRVVFHEEPWHEQLPLIANAAMVLVLQQHDHLSLLRQLTLADINQQFYVFASEGCGLDVMDQKHRLQIFDWQAAASDPDNLFTDEINKRAKAINLRYAHIYGGVEETEANSRLEWEKLNSFTRYSNISSADYHEVQCKILEAENLPADFDRLPPQWQECLSELEHIRWCRYHYLNNWRYGVPANGKNKDAALRIHTDLIEYQALSEEDKEKDRENIRILFSLDEQ